VVDGVDVEGVTRQLKQAYSRLRAIDAAAHGIAAHEFRQRLSGITATGRSILAALEQNPRDAPRARRFLHLYLESAERVTTEYARTHARVRNPPLDDNFRRLLVEMEQTFAAQQKKLVERDMMSLEVDMEVLHTRLRNEGRGPLYGSE
jgi:5-bromo-4-chloroindolyl phosphate hydrolysis protein